MIPQSISNRVEASHDFVSTLGSSNAPNLRKPSKPYSDVDTRDGTFHRARRGQKGISSKAKRLLRSALTILQKVRGKVNLSFLTCTIPTSSNEYHYLIVSNWASITNRFIEAIKRLLNKRGIVPMVVAVTEIQEKRYRKYGIIAPHLHLVFAGRNNRYQQWAISVKEITELWQRILKNHIGIELDCKAATKIETIKKDVKNYLSKYMSKGGTLLDEIKANGLGQYLPTSWYYCTDNLKEAAKKAVVKLHPAIAAFVYDKREYLKSIGIISWFHVVTLELNDYQTGFTYTRNVGMVGAFNDKIPIPQLLHRLEVLMFEQVNDGEYHI